MDSTTEKKSSLPPQESRTSRSGHGGTIVPDPPASLSSAGPTDGCSARPSAESAIAMDIEEGKATGFEKPGPSYKKRKRIELRRRLGDEREVQTDPEVITVKSGEEEGESESCCVSGCGSGGGSGGVDSGSGDSGAKKKPRKGRPQTTGLYAGRAEAQRKLADQEERLLRLRQEKELRALTMEDFYKKCCVDVEEAIERMRPNPNADLSSRVRELQRNVMHVAKVSSSIKGDKRKLLKDSALFTTACVEVLRTRLDDGPDTDVNAQIRELRRELDGLKEERREALEKISALERALQEKEEGLKRIDVLEEALRKRLSPDKDRRETLRSFKKTKKYVESSSEEDDILLKRKSRAGSSSISPRNGERLTSPRQVEESTGGEMGESASVAPSSSAPPSEVGVVMPPPRKDMPPVRGPRIRGKPRIIEERTLAGQDRFLIAKAESPKSPIRGMEMEKAMSAVGLFEQLVPMLNQWMESRLGALIPLTQREPQKKKRKAALPDGKGTPGPAPPFGKGDPVREIMPRETREKDTDERSSGRELYSLVLGRRKKVAVNKQQRKGNEQEKAKPAGSVLSSTAEREGTSMSGTPKGKPK